MVMSSCVQNINDPLTLLRYFNIFKHPLKLDEIYKFSPETEAISNLKQYLNEMEMVGCLKKIDDFYLCNDADEKCINKRLDGEKKAAELLPKAKSIGKILSHFPFVKFVGISGSLSKGYANDKSDFDFFIITANNTLWICRTILHILKKISFLFGKQHFLCMNYFMDEQHLTLEERNIFTQIELSTLIPVYNKKLYYLFLHKNKNLLPNLSHLNIEINEQDLGIWEIINNRPKNKFWKPLNIFLMKLTDVKWRRKWKRKKYPMDDYDLAFKTTPYISKNHYKNTQKMVIQKLANIQS